MKTNIEHTLHLEYSKTSLQDEKQQQWRQMGVKEKEQNISHCLASRLSPPDHAHHCSNFSF